ncbi:hypothetical protein WDU94_014891 [Cyamophila willieti]
MSSTNHKSAAALKYPPYSSRETARIGRPPPPYYMSAQDVTKNNMYNPLYANSLSLRNTADLRRSKWDACSYSEYTRPVPYPTSSNIPPPPAPNTDYNSSHFYSQYAPSFPLQPNPVLNGGSYPMAVSMPTYNCNYTTSTSAKLSSASSAPVPAPAPTTVVTPKPPDKKLDIDVREYLATWDDDADDDTSIKPSEPEPIVVLDCTSLEGDGLAQVREKLKGRSVQVVPSGLGDPKLPYDLDMGNATIVQVQHSDLTVQKDAGKSHQPLDFTKSIIDSSGTEKPAKKAEFEALVSYYGDAKKGDCHFDLAEISERFVDATAKVLMDEKPIEKSKSEGDKRPLNLMEDPEQYIMPTIINKSDYNKVNSAGSMCNKREATEFCSKPNTEFCSKPDTTLDYCSKTNNTQDFCSKPSNTQDYCNKPIRNTLDFPSRSNNTLEFPSRHSNVLEFPTRPVTAPEMCSRSNNTLESISRPATTLGFSSKPSNSFEFCSNPINMPELCNKPVTGPEFSNKSMNLSDFCNKSITSQELCTKTTGSLDYCNKPVNETDFCSKSETIDPPDYCRKSMDGSDYSSKPPDFDTSPYFKKRKWYHSYCNDNQETPVTSSTQYTETNYFFDKRFESSCPPVSCLWENAPTDVKTAHSKSSDLNLSSSDFSPHKTSYSQDEDNLKSFTKDYLIEQNKVLTRNVQISPIKGNPLMSSGVSYTQIVENGILKNAPVEDNNFVSEDKRTTICDSDYSICRNPVTHVEKIKNENKNSFDPLLSSARRSSYKSDDLEDDDKKSVLDDCETDDNPGDYISHEIGKDDDNLSFFCENSFDGDAIDDLKDSPDILPSKPSVSSDSSLPLNPESCKVSEKIKKLKDMKKISSYKKENISKMRDFRKKKLTVDVMEAVKVEPKESEIRKPIKITVQKTKVRVKSKENEVKYKTQFKLKTSKDSECDRKEIRKVIKNQSNSSSIDGKGCAKNKKIKPMKKLQPVREETTCQKLRKFKFKLLKQSGVLGFPKFPNPNVSKVYDFPGSDEDKKHKEQKDTKFSDVSKLKETPKPDSARENLHQSKTSNMLNIELDEICDSSKLASSSEHLVSIKSEIVSVSSSKCTSISSDNDSLSTAFLGNEKCSDENEEAYTLGKDSATTAQSLLVASRQVPFNNPALFQDSNVANQDLKQKYFESQKLSKNFQLVEENLRRLHGESSSQKSIYASNEVENWSCAKPNFFERTDFKNVNTLFCNTSSKPTHYQENLVESTQLLQQTGRDPVQETHPNCMFSQPYFDQTTVHTNSHSYYGISSKNSNYLNSDYLPKYTGSSRQNQINEGRESDIFNLNNFDQNPFLKADSNLTYSNHNNMHKIDREIGIRETRNSMQYFNRNGKSDLNETVVLENVRSQDTFTEKQLAHEGDGCDLDKNVTQGCKNVPLNDCETSSCKELSAESKNQHCVNLQSKILEIKKECLKTRESVDLIFKETKQEKAMMERQLSIQENSSKISKCVQNGPSVSNTEPSDLNHQKGEDSFENFDGNDKSSDHYLDYFVSDSSITEEKPNTVCDNILGKDAEVKECSAEKTNPSEKCSNSCIDNEPTVLKDNNEPNLVKDCMENCQYESTASTKDEIQYTTSNVKELNLLHHQTQSGVGKELLASHETLCNSGNNDENATRNKKYCLESKLQLDAEVDVVEGYINNTTEECEAILGSSTNNEPQILVSNSKEYEIHKSDRSVLKVANTGIESVFNDKANILESTETSEEHSSSSNIVQVTETITTNDLNICLNEVELGKPAQATSNDLIEGQTDFSIDSKRYDPTSHLEKIDLKEIIFLENDPHKEKNKEMDCVFNTKDINNPTSKIETNQQLHDGQVNATNIRDKKEQAETITFKVDESKVLPEVLNDKGNFSLETSADNQTLSSIRQERDPNSENKGFLEVEKKDESSVDTIDELRNCSKNTDPSKFNESFDNNDLVDSLENSTVSISGSQSEIPTVIENKKDLSSVVNEYCNKMDSSTKEEVINDNKEVINEEIMDLKHKDNVSIEHVEEARNVLLTLDTQLPGHKKSEEQMDQELTEVNVPTENHSIFSSAANEHISLTEENAIFPSAADKFNDDDDVHDHLPYDKKQSVQCTRIDSKNESNTDKQNEPCQLDDGHDFKKEKEKQTIQTEIINDSVQSPKNDSQNVYEPNETLNVKKKNESTEDKQKDPNHTNDSLHFQQELLDNENKLSGNQNEPNNNMQHEQIQQNDSQNVHKPNDKQNGTNEKKNEPEDKQKDPRQLNNLNVQHELPTNQNELTDDQYESDNMQHEQIQQNDIPNTLHELNDNRNEIIGCQMESKDKKDVQSGEINSGSAVHERNKNQNEFGSLNETYVEQQNIHSPQSESQSVVIERLTDSSENYKNVPCQFDDNYNVQNELNEKHIELKGDKENGQITQNDSPIVVQLTDNPDILSNSKNEPSAAHNKHNDKNQIQPNDEKQKLQRLQNNNPSELNESEQNETLKEPNEKQNETKENQNVSYQQNHSQNVEDELNDKQALKCQSIQQHGEEFVFDNDEHEQREQNDEQNILNQINDNDSVPNVSIYSKDVHNQSKAKKDRKHELKSKQLQCELNENQYAYACTEPKETLKGRPTQLVKTLTTSVGKFRVYKVKSTTLHSNSSMESCQVDKLFCNEVQNKMNSKHLKDIAHEPITRRDNQNKQDNPDTLIKLNRKEISVSEDIEKRSISNEVETSVLKVAKTCANKGNLTTLIHSSYKHIHISPPSKKKESSSCAEMIQKDTCFDRIQTQDILTNPSGFNETNKEQNNSHLTSNNKYYVSNKDTCSRNEETSPLLQIPPSSKITTAANVYNYICVNFDEERKSLGYDRYNKLETVPITRSPITTVHTYNRVFEQNNVLMKHKPRNLANHCKTIQRYGKTYSINKVKTFPSQNNTLNPTSSKSNEVKAPNERNKSGTNQQSLNKKREKDIRNDVTLKVKETRKVADAPFKSSSNIVKNPVNSKPEITLKTVKTVESQSKLQSPPFVSSQNTIIEEESKVPEAVTGDANTETNTVLTLIATKPINNKTLTLNHSNELPLNAALPILENRKYETPFRENNQKQEENSLKRTKSKATIENSIVEADENNSSVMIEKGNDEKADSLNVNNKGQKLIIPELSSQKTDIPGKESMRMNKKHLEADDESRCQSNKPKTDQLETDHLNVGEEDSSTSEKIESSKLVPIPIIPNPSNQGSEIKKIELNPTLKSHIIKEKQCTDLEDQVKNIEGLLKPKREDDNNYVLKNSDEFKILTNKCIGSQIQEKITIENGLSKENTTDEQPNGCPVETNDSNPCNQVHENMLGSLDNNVTRQDLKSSEPDNNSSKKDTYEESVIGKEQQSINDEKTCTLISYLADIAVHSTGESNISLEETLVAHNFPVKNCHEIPLPPNIDPSCNLSDETRKISNKVPPPIPNYETGKALNESTPLLPFATDSNKSGKTLNEPIQPLLAIAGPTNELTNETSKISNELNSRSNEISTTSCDYGMRTNEISVLSTKSINVPNETKNSSCQNNDSSSETNNCILNQTTPIKRKQFLKMKSIIRFENLKRQFVPKTLPTPKSKYGLKKLKKSQKTEKSMFHDNVKETTSETTEVDYMHFILNLPNEKTVETCPTLDKPCLPHQEMPLEVMNNETCTEKESNIKLNNDPDKTCKKDPDLDNNKVNVDTRLNRHHDESKRKNSKSDSSSCRDSTSEKYDRKEHRADRPWRYDRYDRSSCQQRSAEKSRIRDRNSHLNYERDRTRMSGSEKNRTYSSSSADEKYNVSSKLRKNSSTDSINSQHEDNTRNMKFALSNENKTHETHKATFKRISSTSTSKQELELYSFDRNSTSRTNCEQNRERRESANIGSPVSEHSEINEEEDQCFYSQDCQDFLVIDSWSDSEDPLTTNETKDSENAKKTDLIEHLTKSDERVSMVEKQECEICESENSNHEKSSNDTVLSKTCEVDEDLPIVDGFNHVPPSDKVETMNYSSKSEIEITRTESLGEPIGENLPIFCPVLEDNLVTTKSNSTLLHSDKDTISIRESVQIAEVEPTIISKTFETVSFELCTKQNEEAENRTTSVNIVERMLEIKPSENQKENDETSNAIAVEKKDDNLQFKKQTSICLENTQADQDTKRDEQSKAENNNNNDDDETRNNCGEQSKLINNNEEIRNDDEEPLKVIDNNHDESRNGTEEQLKVIENNVEIKIDQYIQTNSKELLNHDDKETQNSVIAVIQGNERDAKATVDISDEVTESNERDIQSEPESFVQESSKTEHKLHISEVDTLSNQVDLDSNEQTTSNQPCENQPPKDFKSSPTFEISQGKLLTNHDQKKHVFRDLTRECKITSPEKNETKQNPKLSKYKDFIAAQKEKCKFMRKGISKADAEIISSQTDFSYGLRERKVKDVASQENRRLSLRINSNLKRKNPDEVVPSSNEKKRKSIPTKINKNVYNVASESSVQPTHESLDKNDVDKSNGAVDECTSDSNMCTVITNGDTIFIQLKSQSDNIAIVDAMQSDCYVVIDNEHLMNETPLVIFDGAGEQIRMESNTEMGKHITEPDVEPSKETPPTLKPFYEIKNSQENVKSIPVLKPEHLVESDATRPKAETQSKSSSKSAKKVTATENIHYCSRSEKKKKTQSEKSSGGTKCSKRTRSTEKYKSSQNEDVTEACSLTYQTGKDEEGICNKNKASTSSHPSSNVRKAKLWKKSSLELSPHIQQKYQGSEHENLENVCLVDMDCKENPLKTSSHPSLGGKKDKLGKKSSSSKTSPELSQHQQKNKGTEHENLENACSLDMDCKENFLATKRNETVSANNSSQITENSTSQQKTVNSNETTKCFQRIKNKRKLLKSFDEDENMNKITGTDETSKPEINTTEKILDNIEDEKKKATKESIQNENKSITKAKRKYFEKDNNEPKSTNHGKDSNPSQMKNKTHELPQNNSICPKKIKKENELEKTKESSLIQKYQEVTKDRKWNSKDSSGKQPIGVKNPKTPTEKNIDSKKTSNPNSSLKRKLNAFDANLSLFKSDDRDLKSIKRIIKKTTNKIEKPPEPELQKCESSYYNSDLNIKSNTTEESKENTTNVSVDENITDINVYSLINTEEKDAEKLLEEMVSATLIPLSTAKNSLCIKEKSNWSEDSITPPTLRLSEKGVHSKGEEVIENNQKLEKNVNESNMSCDIEFTTENPLDAMEEDLHKLPEVCANASESHMQNEASKGDSLNVFPDDVNSVTTKTNFENKTTTSELHYASHEMNLSNNSETCNESLSEKITETTISDTRSSCSSESKIEDPFAILIQEVNNELKNAYNYSKQVAGFESPLHHNVRNLLFKKRNNMDGSPKPYYDEVSCAQEIENMLLNESRALSPFSERMLKANNENPFELENPGEYFHHDIDYSRKTRHWQVRDTIPSKQTPSPPIILGDNPLMSTNSPIGQQNITPPMLIRPNIILDDLIISNEEAGIEELCKPSTSSTEEPFDSRSKENWVSEPELSDGINHSFNVSTEEVEQNQLSARIELPSFSEIALKLSGTESFVFGTEKCVEDESIRDVEKVSALQPEVKTGRTECEKKDEVQVKDKVVDEQHNKGLDEHLTEPWSESSTKYEMIPESVSDTHCILKTQVTKTADITSGDNRDTVGDAENHLYNNENIAVSNEVSTDEEFTPILCQNDGNLCENPLATSVCEISDRLYALKLVTDSISSCVLDELAQDEEIADQAVQSDEESRAVEELPTLESTDFEKEGDQSDEELRAVEELPTLESTDFEKEGDQSGEESRAVEELPTLESTDFEKEGDQSDEESRAVEELPTLESTDFEKEGDQSDEESRAVEELPTLESTDFDKEGEQSDEKSRAVEELPTLESTDFEKEGDQSDVESRAVEELPTLESTDFEKEGEQSDEESRAVEELPTLESTDFEKEGACQNTSEVIPHTDEVQEYEESNSEATSVVSDSHPISELTISQEAAEEEEMLTSSIMDWPYLEEEVVTQDDEDKINAFEDLADLRIKLPWSKIFDLKDGCDSESADSQQRSLDLGPVEIKLQLNSFQTSCLKVKRLILQKAHSESSDRDVYEDMKANQPSVALSREDLIEEMLNNQVLCIKLQDIVSCDFCGKQLLSQVRFYTQNKLPLSMLANRSTDFFA